MTIDITRRSNDSPASRRVGQAYPLVFDRVTKRYGTNTVVDDLSFTVQPGRVTGFLGPNGSGKSTTMKILLGLASADHGRATIGERLYRDLDNPAGTVGAILDSNAFHPGRSGRNHLFILADAIGIAHSRIEQALVLAGLAGEAADRRVGTYSLGMKQRLSLAAALLGDPPILVLDEPGNGLDPQGIRTLRKLLQERAAKGDTVLVSSHLLSEVEHLVDDLVVIAGGRLITTGSIRELQQGATLVRTDSPDQLTHALEAAGANVERREPDALIVGAMPIAEIGKRAFEASIILHELSPHAGSLEELFLGWTSPEASDRSEETI